MYCCSLDSDWSVVAVYLYNDPNPKPISPDTNLDRRKTCYTVNKKEFINITYKARKKKKN